MMQESNQANLLHISKQEGEKFKKDAILFYDKAKKIKEIQDKYLSLKSDLTKKMSNFFFVNGIDKAITFDTHEDSGEDIKLIVRKIQKTNIVFDPDKLERKFDKSILKDVIDKKYEIIDMKGLTNYLKSINANPSIFKSFINVSKSVNADALEQKDALGLISEKDLKGCYTVNKYEPYFSVKKGKGQGDKS